MHALVRDWRSADLSPRERALCEFATQVTHRRWPFMPSCLDELRGHGFDDRAIHDAVQVIGYFNYITRVADALGVEPEDFVAEWGE